MSGGRGASESSRSLKGVLLAILEGLPSGDGTLHHQIYMRIRGAIMDGGLAGGSRLPSTRTLARDLGVSRQTTEDAFAQLQAEGFLLRRVGDGSYVSPPDPDLILRRGAMPSPPRPEESRRAIAARGRRIAGGTACREPLIVRPFNAGLPALEEFPHALWHRLLARRSRRSGDKLLGYGEPEGYRPLREAVASYVRAVRGVDCEAEQVLILTSSQQALDLTARLLADPGDGVWLEEPAYPGARWAFEGTGLRVVPVPVDAFGLDVATGRARAPKARLAYVTPSHQYPLGVTLTLARRLALLEWARSARAWIIEDDYDSEFRYDGKPLASLQGLDSSHRVLYLGTFTKVMSPSLRLAYLVLPVDLVESFVTARSLVDGHTPTLLQAVLADFIEEGHFSGHIRRMRALYGERRDVLVDALRRDVGANLTLGPAEAGFHVAGHLGSGLVEGLVIREGLTRGLELRGLSAFYAGPSAPGLVLAFGGLPPAAIRRGVKALAASLAAASSRRQPRRR